MCEPDEPVVPEQIDDDHATTPPRAADQRLRPFRIGADNPLLVLPDERRDDVPPPDDGAAT